MRVFLWLICYIFSLNYSKTVKGPDLLPVSTYDSWTLLWNPDLIFLTSSNICETDTTKRLCSYQSIGLPTALTTMANITERVLDLTRIYNEWLLFKTVNLWSFLTQVLSKVCILDGGNLRQNLSLCNQPRGCVIIKLWEYKPMYQSRLFHSGCDWRNLTLGVIFLLQEEGVLW